MPSAWLDTCTCCFCLTLALLLLLLLLPLSCPKVITGGGWSQMSTAAYRLQSGSQIVIRFATSNGRGGDAAVFIDQVTLLKLDCGNPFRICANATEGTSLTLACPAGYRISSVPFASYGTPTPGAPISSTTCSIVNGASTFTKSSCHAATSQSIFDGNCTRTSQCQIPVNNAAFGVDPCPYTVKWAEAQANCLPAGCQWSETDFVRCAIASDRKPHRKAEGIGRSPTLLTLAAPR